ncbi:MAG: hypothetical protein AAFQ66_05525 [Pseudomonadota bacterium]
MALVVITGLVAATARHSVSSATLTALSEHRVENAAMIADLVTVGIAMAEDERDDFLLPRHDLWVKIQPAAGLVDLNAAPIALIAAIFEAAGVRSNEALTQLETDRRGNPAAYRSVRSALGRLGIAEPDRNLLAPYFTVETALSSINPDLAATELRTSLTNALSGAAIAPLTDNTGDIILLITAPEEGETGTPALYLERSLLGPYRLRTFRDGF